MQSPCVVVLFTARAWFCFAFTHVRRGRFRYERPFCFTASNKIKNPCSTSGGTDCAAGAAPPGAPPFISHRRATLMRWIRRWRRPARQLLVRALHLAAPPRHRAVRTHPRHRRQPPRCRRRRLLRADRARQARGHRVDHRQGARDDTADWVHGARRCAARAVARRAARPSGRLGHCHGALRGKAQPHRRRARRWGRRRCRAARRPLRGGTHGAGPRRRRSAANDDQARAPRARRSDRRRRCHRGT